MGGEPRWTGCDGEASERIKGMKWQCLGVKLCRMDSHGASDEDGKCVEGLGWWIRSHVSRNEVNKRGHDPRELCVNYLLLRISDHLRRAESFRKDSKGFRLSKRVTQFIELNEFATKTWECFGRCRVFICFCSRLDKLWVFSHVENPLSLFEKTQDWVFCLKWSEICSNRFPRP